LGNAILRQKNLWRLAVPAARKIAFLHTVRIAWWSHPCRQAVHHKKKT